MSVIKFKDINLDNITFEIDQKNSKPSVNIMYKYPGASAPEKGLRVQTNKVSTPFGVGDNLGYLMKNTNQGEGGKLAYNITINTKGNERMAEIVQEIQELAMDFVEENSETFFKKKLSRETLDMLFTKSIKKPINPKYPDLLFNTKVYCDESGKLSTKVVYPDGETAVLTADNRDEVFPKMSEAMMLLQLNNIYFVNGKFGLTWRANKARVYKSARQDLEFLPEDSDDESCKDPEDEEDADNFIEDSDEVESVPVVKSKPITVPAASGSAVAPRRARKN